MGSAWSKSCSHVRHSMGYTTTLNVVRETTNYNPCEWVVRKFASDLRNELISLFVGIRCFFSARLIRSAVGEVDGMPDGHCTSERLVTAWVAKRVIGSASCNVPLHLVTLPGNRTHGVFHGSFPMSRGPLIRFVTTSIMFLFHCLHCHDIVFPPDHYVRYVILTCHSYVT